MRARGGVEREEVVGLATHDEQVGLLRRRQVRRGGERIEEAVQARVVPVRRGVARRRDDADLDVLFQEVEQARHDGAGGLQALPVVVERDVSVERRQLQAAVGRDGHDLARVQNEAHIVEAGTDKSPRADVPLAVLELEGRLKGQPREEGPYCRH